MGEFAAEAHAIHRIAHAAELERIENPRPNERLWDVVGNRRPPCRDGTLACSAAAGGRAAAGLAFGSLITALVYRRGALGGTPPAARAGGDRGRHRALRLPFLASLMTGSGLVSAVYAAACGVIAAGWLAYAVETAWVGGRPPRPCWCRPPC